MEKKKSNPEESGVVDVQWSSRILTLPLLSVNVNGLWVCFFFSSFACFRSPRLSLYSLLTTHTISHGPFKFHQRVSGRKWAIIYIHPPTSTQPPSPLPFPRLYNIELNGPWPENAEAALELRNFWLLVAQRDVERHESLIFFLDRISILPSTPDTYKCCIQ